MAKVKITVFKTIDPTTIFGEIVPVNPMTGKNYEVCPKFKEGQEYIIEDFTGIKLSEKMKNLKSKDYYNVQKNNSRN